MGTDWYPNSRDDQLHLVKTWNTVFATQGQTWGIPQEHITQLVNDEAESAPPPMLSSVTRFLRSWRPKLASSKNIFCFYRP